VGDLDTHGTFNSVGLGYDGTPFGDSNRNYVPKDHFAIEFEAGTDIRPSTAHYVADAIEANFDDLSKLDPSAYNARLHEIIENEHLINEPRPTDPDALKAWEDALAEKHTHVDYALDTTNPHRGNGFGGEKGHYNPELQILGRVPLPDGAEMWKITPDGTRTLVGRFTNELWEIVV